MEQNSSISATKRGKEGKSERVHVTFDKSIYDLIHNTEELGTSDSSKVQNICVAWLSEKGILSGIIKNRLNIK